MTTIALDTKIREVENKIPDVRLKKIDYDAKTSDSLRKCFYFF